MKVDLYCKVMTEIKKRIGTVESFLKHQKTTGYKMTDLEFLCLQIRKILELISLSSLIANQEEFDKQAIKYSKYYHASRILQDIESINPGYYPQPIEEKSIIYNGKMIREHVNLSEGYLTKEEFIKVYEKCGKMAHAENPFGSSIDVKYYTENIPLWYGKIIKLLNSHSIKLLNDENLYVVHMNEKRDDKVHAYIFQKVEEGIK